MSLSSLVKLQTLTILNITEVVPNLKDECIAQPIEECTLDLNTNLTTKGVIHESQNMNIISYPGMVLVKEETIWITLPIISQSPIWGLGTGGPRMRISSNFESLAT